MNKSKKSIDGQAILKALEGKKKDRGRVTLYLSKSLYQTFQKHCGDVAASEVVEELMRAFIEGTKAKA